MIRKGNIIGCLITWKGTNKSGQSTDRSMKWSKPKWMGDRAFQKQVSRFCERNKFKDGLTDKKPSVLWEVVNV